MKTILMIELKGFEGQGASLGERMSAIGLSEEKVRSAIRALANSTIQEVCVTNPALRVEEIGGDTWTIELRDVSTAVDWGVRLLKTLEQKVLGGLFYLKPVVSVSCGDLKVQGGRFMDGASIRAYRAADKGEPFCFYAVGAAQKMVAEMKHVPTTKIEGAHLILWQQLALDPPLGVRAGGLSLAHLMLDNEVLFFRSHGDVLNFLQEQQTISQEIKVYGGPAPLRLPVYRDYNKSIEVLLRTTNARCSVLNYVNESASQDAVDWLTMCQLLKAQYPGKFTHNAYVLPGNAIKPVSYHVYDDVTVIMLRSFDEFAQSHSVSGSIVVRGAEIARRFRDDFRESFRSIGQSEPEALLARLVAQGADRSLAEKRAKAALLGEPIP